MNGKPFRDFTLPAAVVWRNFVNYLTSFGRPVLLIGTDSPDFYNLVPKET
jgi:hypothetical protein